MIEFLMMLGAVVSLAGMLGLALVCAAGAFIAGTIVRQAYFRLADEFQVWRTLRRIQYKAARRHYTA